MGCVGQQYDFFYGERKKCEILEVKVKKDVWDHFGGRVGDHHFSIRLNDQEVIDVECFFQRLQRKRMCRDAEN